MHHPAPPELLTAKELADRLGWSYAAVLAGVREGWVPALKVGRTFYFNPTAVVEAIRRYRGLGDEAIAAALDAGDAIAV